MHTFSVFKKTQVSLHFICMYVYIYSSLYLILTKNRVWLINFYLLIFLLLFRRSLESLGAIPYKMRIRANDDVYETTRHRMAVAEENNKNKWYGYSHKQQDIRRRPFDPSGERPSFFFFCFVLFCFAKARAILSSPFPEHRRASRNRK